MKVAIMAIFVTLKLKKYFLVEELKDCIAIHISKRIKKLI